MITYPNAKINLGLNVVAKRPDGYHDLETIFYPINLQDALEVNLRAQASGAPTEPDRAGTRPAPTLSMSGCGPFVVGRPRGSSLQLDDRCNVPYRLHVTGANLDGSPADNLVVKAYMLMNERHHLRPVDIHLHKHIPTEAGLGGGSSDCAFMIKMLNSKFNLGLSVAEMEIYASKLGSDCPFFIQNKPVFATGTGNVFEPISLSLKGMNIVLVKPEISVSTREAYANICPKKPEVSLKEIAAKPIEEWKDLMKNDFEKNVFLIHPEIAAIKDKLYDMGAVYAQMSGSGSAVFGIFKEPQENIDEVFAGYFTRQRVLE